jgi:5-methylcytosine-specific restriction enzyme subunit McrC
LSSSSYEDAESGGQPFLRFDGDKAWAKNYVGFLQSGDDLIEIFPKVFEGQPEEFGSRGQMIKHLFFWLNHCRTGRLPFDRIRTDAVNIDTLPELLLYLIAKQFNGLVTEMPLSLYQFEEATLQIPRGRINFNRYVSSGLSRGAFHVIECDYEPLKLDNKVNRAIKFCSRLILKRTAHLETANLAQETLFILEDVEDTPVGRADLNGITLNSFFKGYEDALESCRLLVNQTLYSASSDESLQWSFLVKMETIFEEFVANVLEWELADDFHVELQKSDQYLVSKPEAFQMRHDILLTSRKDPQRSLIIDTKYKLRNAKNDSHGTKWGVVQGDLYQMVSYAFRRGVSDVVLLYPNRGEDLGSIDCFEIKSGAQPESTIRITAANIPFWSLSEFDSLLLRLRQSIREIVLGALDSKS